MTPAKLFQFESSLFKAEKKNIFPHGVPSGRVIAEVPALRHVERVLHAHLATASPLI